MICWKLFIFLNVLVLLFAGLCHSSESEANLFATSIELYKREDFVGSEKVLTKLVGIAPQNGLYWFNLGNTSFMSKNYEASIRAYRKNIALNSPLAPAAKLYLAKSLAQLGKTNEAIQILKSLKNERTHAGIQREAEGELQSLSEKQEGDTYALALYQSARYVEAEARLKRKPASEVSANERLLLALALIKQNKKSEAETLLRKLSMDRGLSEEDKATVKGLLVSASVGKGVVEATWLALDLSYGSTNNAYLDGKSLDPISSAFMRLYLSAGHHFNPGAEWSQKLNYFLGFENPDAAPELQTLTHTLEGTFLYERSGMSTSLTPYFQHQTWSGNPVSTKVGGSFKASDAWEKVSAGFEIDFASQAAMDSSVDYLNGSSHTLRPYLGWRESHYYAQFYWQSGSEGLQDIVFNDGSRLPLNQKYQGPGVKVFWTLSGHSALMLNLNQIKRSYSSVALPSGKNRNDTENNLFIKYTHFFSQKLSVYGLAELGSNVSTLDSTDIRDKNYESRTFSLGLNWEVF